MELMHSDGPARPEHPGPVGLGGGTQPGGGAGPEHAGAARKLAALVILGWLVVSAICFVASKGLSAHEHNGPASYLPGGAPSAKVLALLRKLPGGSDQEAIMVFWSRSGLGTEASDDLARQRDQLLELSKQHAGGIEGVGPIVFSPKGTAAVYAVNLSGSGSAIETDIARLRRGLPHVKGLRDGVTGPAAFNADIDSSFSGVDTTLLAATAALVVILLIVIYKSPLLWILPLVCVGAAEALAQGLVSALVHLGFTLSGESAGLLTVIVFGAGTDYALLLTARYRELLLSGQDHQAALSRSLRSVGPTLAASCATVVTSLLCLLASSLTLSQGFGVVGAIGVVSALAVMVSLYPALLALFGKAVFWPWKPLSSSQTKSPLWTRLASWVGVHPGRSWVAPAILLGACGIGLVAMNTDVTTVNDLPSSMPAVVADHLLARAFPAGASAPLQVVVKKEREIEHASHVLAADPVVAGVSDGPSAGSGSHELAELLVILHAPPSGPKSFAAVEQVRSVLQRSVGGAALVGGQSAQDLDVRLAASRDEHVVLPLVFAVVLLLLFLVTGALLGSLILAASIALTFVAALGVGTIASMALGFPGIDPTVPALTFVFLVALGADYTIFLAMRVREERKSAHGAASVTHALVETGPVLTAAGVVLAGTFATLALIPVIPSKEIGLVVAVGVLADTFIVRTLVVPGLMVQMDRWFWWPGRQGQPARKLGKVPSLHRMP